VLFPGLVRHVLVALALIYGDSVEAFPGPPRAGSGARAILAPRRDREAVAAAPEKRKNRKVPPV